MPKLPHYTCLSHSDAVYCSTISAIVQLVRILGSHPSDPGSSPGGGSKFKVMWSFFFILMLFLVAPSAALNGKCIICIGTLQFVIWADHEGDIECYVAHPHHSCFPVTMTCMSWLWHAQWCLSASISRDSKTVCASLFSWRTVRRNLTGLRECQKSKHEHTKQHHIEEMLLLNAIYTHHTPCWLQREQKLLPKQEQLHHQFVKNQICNLLHI